MLKLNYNFSESKIHIYGAINSRTDFNPTLERYRLPPDGVINTDMGLKETGNWIYENWHLDTFAGQENKHEHCLFIEWIYQKTLSFSAQGLARIKLCG